MIMLNKKVDDNLREENYLDLKSQRGTGAIRHAALCTAG